MKFNQKLIELRKQKGLSQEELGYELSVTRQTISKWELGLSTPDMDKLMEISRFFNISIDDLTNENKGTNTNSTNNSSRVNPEFVGVNTDYIPEDLKTKQYVQEPKKHSKYLMFLPFLLPIVFFIVVIIIMNVANKKTDEKISNIRDSYFNNTSSVSNLVEDIQGITNSDIIKNDINTANSNTAANNQNLSFNVRSYNAGLELNEGTISAFFVESVIDDVISKPAEVTDVVIIYNDIEARSVSELTSLKDKISNSSKEKYSVSLEYGPEGYINKITIEDVQ